MVLVTGLELWYFELNKKGQHGTGVLVSSLAFYLNLLSVFQDSACPLLGSHATLAFPRWYLLW